MTARLHQLPSESRCRVDQDEAAADPRHRAWRRQAQQVNQRRQEDAAADAGNTGEQPDCATQASAKEPVLRRAQAVRQLGSRTLSDHLQRRDLREELRASGMVSGGPDSYGKKDLQDFANALDRYVTARRREVQADH